LKPNGTLIKTPGRVPRRAARRRTAHHVGEAAPGGMGMGMWRPTWRAAMSVLECIHTSPSGCGKRCWVRGRMCRMRRPAPMGRDQRPARAVLPRNSRPGPAKPPACSAQWPAQTSRAHHAASVRRISGRRYNYPSLRAPCSHSLGIIQIQATSTHGTTHLLPVVSRGVQPNPDAVSPEAQQQGARRRALQLRVLLGLAVHFLDSSSPRRRAGVGGQEGPAGVGRGVPGLGRAALPGGGRWRHAR